MEAEVQTIEKPLLERLADKLMTAQQELDELAIQLALGKAEAKDKFEEVKSDFKFRLNEFKFTTIGKILGMAAERMQAHVEELEDHLTTGKAESRIVFEAQLIKILDSLKSLELEIKERLPKTEDIHMFQYEVEKFKLKLGILRLRYELNKLELRDEFYDGLAAARKVINTIKKSAKEKVNAGAETLNEFKVEVEEVFVHLRKAIAAL